VFNLFANIFQIVGFFKGMKKLVESRKLINFIAHYSNQFDNHKMIDPSLLILTKHTVFLAFQAIFTKKHFSKHLVFFTALFFLYYFSFYFLQLHLLIT